MTLKDQIERWKQEEIMIVTKEKEISKEKEACAKTLKEQYGDLHEERQIFRDVFSDISEELNLILQSAVVQSKIVKVPSESWGRPSSLNLTQKHGLKNPRVWNSFFPLDDVENENYSAEMLNDRFEVKRRPSNDSTRNLETFLTIDFSCLKGIKSIHQEKLSSFLEQFKKALELKLRYIALSMEYKKLQNGKDKIASLSTYSSAIDFAEAFKMIEGLGDKPFKHKERIEALGLEVKVFLSVLKEINKPFRILKTLKDTPH